MRLKFFVFPLLLMSLLTTQSSAQHHIAVNGGVGLPTGNYASESLTNSEAGFAETGFQLGVDYTNIIGDWAGFKASVSYGQNPVNSEFLLNTLKSSYNFNVTQEEASNRSYQHWAIMVGPSLAFKTENFVFNFNTSGGYLNTRYPGIRLSLKGEDGIYQYSVTSEQESAKSGGFCFMVNGGLNYKLSSLLVLNFDLTFSTAGQEFNIITSSEETRLRNNSQISNQAESPTEIDINVNRFLIKTGIGFNLN